MRIAVVNHARRKIGGVENYLDAVIPALAGKHEIAFLYESDTSGREPISVPSDAPAWETAQLGRSQALHRLKDWNPDVCFVQGLENTALEAGVVALGNAVLYVHNYYGTCISGQKMVVNGTSKPCDRKFGPACLVRYFPDHCGGSNPLTMLRLYQTQWNRLQLMKNYRKLITNSEHMSREISRYGLSSECIYPFTGGTTTSTRPAAGFNDDRLEIIFSGRMTNLKGGSLLVEAMPHVQHTLKRKLHVTFCGDGPERKGWQQRAAQLRTDAIEFEFTGWLTSEQLSDRFASAHLHIMPSVWPEPFGLAGLEAGCYGVPSVAFAVGGVPEWLRDGMNGHLAVTPSSTALAEAIVRSLQDEQHYRELRGGAAAESRRYSLDTHVQQLLQIFQRCAD